MSVEQELAEQQPSSKEGKPVAQTAEVDNPSLISSEGVEHMQKQLIASEQAMPETVEQVQAKLVRSEKAAAQEPEKADIEMQRAALEQQAAIDAKRQEIAKEVQQLAVIDQRLRQPLPSPASKIVTAGATVLVGAKAVELGGNFNRYAREAVEKVAVDGTTIDKVVENLGLKEVKGVNLGQVKDNLGKAADHLVQFCSPENITKTVKNWLSTEGGTLNGFADNAKQLAELAEKVDLKKLAEKGKVGDKAHEELNKKIAKIVGENATPKNIQDIKNIVVDAADGKQKLLTNDNINAVKDSIAKGMEANPFRNIAKNIVEFHDNIPIDNRLLVAGEVAVAATVAFFAHQALTADERKQQEADKEAYKGHAQKIMKEQQELKQLVGVGEGRGGR